MDDPFYQIFSLLSFGALCSDHIDSTKPSKHSTITSKEALFSTWDSWEASIFGKFVWEKKNKATAKRLH